MIAAAALIMGAGEPVIVVTGERRDERRGDARAGAIVIGRSQLADYAPGRIEDLLAIVPGLQPFRRGDSRSTNPSAQGLTLRGLGGNASSRTLVLLDGMPISDPFFGFVPLGALDPERIDNISIVKGAGGGRFGSAVAGTINIDSLALADRPDWRASGALSADHELEIGGGAKVRLGSSVTTLDARWDNGRGFWTTPREQRVRSSVRARFNARSAEVRLIAPVGGGEMHFRMAAYRDERTLRFKGADSLSEGIDTSVRYVSPNSDVTLAAYLQRRNYANVVVSATSLRPVLDQNRTPATGIGGLAEWRAKEWLTIGADARLIEGTAHERALSAATGAVTAVRASGGRSSELGAYAEVNTRAGPLDLGTTVRLTRWEISDGRRIERDSEGTVVGNPSLADRGGTTLTGRASVARRGNHIDWRASAYSGIRVPTLNELYRGFTIFPVTTLANPALEPERVIGADAGVTWRPSSGVRADVSLFANSLENAIANVSLTPTLRQRENVDKLVSRGVEAGLWLERGYWSFEGSVSWLHARIDGKRPAQVPALGAAATLRWSDTKHKFAVTLRHQSASFEDDLNLDHLPATTTVDVMVGQRIGPNASLSVRLENALDERVVTRNQGGSIDLGAPRGVWIMLRITD